MSMLYIFRLRVDLLLFSDIFKKCTEAVPENQAYLTKTYKIRKWFQNQKHLAAEEKCTTFLYVRHVNKKSCIPEGKGKIEVRCPKCGNDFYKEKLSCADNENIELKSKKSVTMNCSKSLTFGRVRCYVGVCFQFQ